MIAIDVSVASAREDQTGANELSNRLTMRKYTPFGVLFISPRGEVRVNMGEQHI